MRTGSFARYLAGLDRAALTGILRVRPDARTRPAPSGFDELATRLSEADSLRAALPAVSRDALAVAQATAVLGKAAELAAVARLVGGPAAAWPAALDELLGHGLAWVENGRVYLPEPLAGRLAGSVGGGRRAAVIARQMRVDDLLLTARALGAQPRAGAGKPELVQAVLDGLADLVALAEVVRALPEPARDHLDALWNGVGRFYLTYPSRPDPGQQGLAEAGLLLKVNERWELPREAAIAAWLAERDTLVTGRPELPLAGVGATAGVGAAEDLSRAVAALLDEAAANAINALKMGGVGPRERSRLAARLALPADVVALGIDLAFAAGLLGRAGAGYAPTPAYQEWRAGPPARQWAALATAWFALEHAPTSRGENPDEKETPPPFRVNSRAGLLRRAVLRAARGGYSVRAAGGHADWYAPLHHYDDEARATKVAANLHEAELLGVVATDALTECGARLIAALDEAAGRPGPLDVVDEVAGQVGDLLVQTPGAVILQSDLTATVSGQPSAAVARLLSAAAVNESRSTAAVWRFSPDSVRTALDAGWDAKTLLAELTALATASGRELPSSLEHLVTDADRRHGRVRVRETRCCVVADEATATEILHTRSLAKLELARLAPTVLSSPAEPDEMLARLRKAGFSPVEEDETGAVIVEERAEHSSDAPRPAAASRMPARLGAAELAAALLAPGEQLDLPLGGPRPSAQESRPSIV